MSTLNFSDQHGVRNLYFGTHFIQGAMRLDDPIALEFEYIQQMMLWTLFIENPSNIVQLGLGAGALTKFCHYHYPNAHTSAIELEQAVIDLCHAEFIRFLPSLRPLPDRRWHHGCEYFLRPRRTLTTYCSNRARL